ncbi:MAG: phage major capsid protein [Rhodoglobus sp.]
MKFADLILAAERELSAHEATRAGYVAEQERLLGDLPDARSSLTEANQARYDELRSLKAQEVVEIDAARVKVDELKREQTDDERLTRSAQERSPGAPVPFDGITTNNREARTYTAESSQRGTSFFVDSFRAQFRNDLNARERIERHQREVEVLQEVRAVSSSGVGGLLVPQYLVDLLVMPTRNGRVYANQVTNVPLPAEGMTLNIPKWTSGTTVTSQNGENTNVSNTDIVPASDLTVNIRTIAGEQDVSRQTLERGTPGIDAILYADLVEAYHAQLGNQVINGDGTANTHLGVRSTAGIPQSTTFAAAVTAALFYKKIAGAIASVSSGQRTANEAALEANLIAMHPRRWGWLTSLTDGDGRPLVNTEWNGPTNVEGMNLNPGKQSLGDSEAAGDRVVGQIHGLPVVTDANIPTNVGTLSEDIVLVSDKRKTLLWEDGDGAPRELMYDQSAPSKLQIKLQVYGYSAFTAGRRVTATAIVGGVDTGAGNGLIAPVLF